MRSLTSLIALLGAMILIAAGCGGPSPDDELSGPSAATIRDNWNKVTGDSLATDAPTKDWTLLKLPEGDDRYETFGVFSLYVAKTRRGRDTLLQDPATKKKMKKESGGIYWRQAEDGKSFAAYKTYGKNIVLSWQAGEKRELDDSFKRLDQTVQAAIAGDPDKLPAEQRSCQSQGIDPEKGTKEGTCRLKDVTVTIVNQDHEAVTPEISARLKGVTTSDTIPPFSQYGTPDRASGKYVVVQYEVENRSKTPIAFLQPLVGLDERTYKEASGVSYNLSGGKEDPFPLQPGQSATVKTAFDVPATVAEQIKDEGVFIVPAGRFESGGDQLTETVAQARIRMAGAPTLPLKGGSSGSGSSAGSGSSDTAQEKHVKTTVRRLFGAVQRRDAPG